MPDLLIELFSEEIPARMQGKAAADLKKLVTDGLVEAGLTYASAGAFSTPRRLALSVEGLLAASPAVKEERKGPKVGAPEQALAGFLRSTGLTQDQLEARDDKKGQVWFAVIDKPGRPAAEIVADVLEQTVRTFPWPKSMRWGDGTLRWVRPLHSILCILSDEAGAEVVPLDIDGIKAGDTTHGHRFMATDAFSVTSFDDYAAKLKRAKVVLDASERADHIWAEATNQAFAQGMEVVEDRGLLTEVAGLVEWPVVLLGKIEEQFLDLPPEVLKTSMKEHQKFFSVKNPKTGRIEQYVTVANIETADQGATILAGNGRVLSARLADAKFFWENDLRIAKAGMQPWIDALSSVTFHNKLGSQKERIDRIAALAREIAPAVGADPDLAEQAARVAKADLSSEMVYEFPELQGLMGRYYSDAAGLPPEVGAACEEHYSPLGPSDDVPTAPVSVAVALADKIDLLTGFWAIDEKPTGSKDPFALRRAALGVIRLVTENQTKLELLKLLSFANGVISTAIRRFEDSKLEDYLKQASQDLDIPVEDLRAAHSKAKEDAKQFDDSIGSMFRYFRMGAGARALLGMNLDEMPFVKSIRRGPDLLSFFHDRLKVFLKDKGIRHDIIDACIAMPNNDDLTLLVKRAEALSETLKTDDGENLIQGFKRANNILSAEEEKDGVSYELDPDPKFAENDEEKALFAALDQAEATIKPAMEQEDFTTAMAAMAKLRGPIDAFFEATQVNSDNQIVRRNRLCLLHRIRTICGGVADLTKIEG
ncbi:glycine--tRNA ligase subunit beta [Litoreibacter arenae]|uniref:Glycine--tRNA ligase beta subunit n=1 Tax=Litoreibacter arenae DSM 19593 TaxID=1123360 RepID=S9QKI0_9RHOB|nr:glycine--tRNA ligase subunit beta [Litoreibacter arenae]EPX80073.1 Glycyl-tRNA synthetase beta chain [Litoreibacter arenae DSM 19593]